MASSILHGLFWKFSERSSVQIVSLVINIILARILTPEDYGIVAMTAIFITLSSVIVDGGFNSALIQKKDADILDFSSVFYFTLFISIILYISLYILAPFISEFYDNKYPQLTDVLRVLGIQVIVYGINSIQVAYVSRKMMFKNIFWASLIGTLISAIVGVIMACSGFGVWAIVAQQLTSSITNTLTLLIITKKLPKLIFSANRLRELLNYGVKLFGASLMINIFQEIRAIIIGKLYSAKELALFDRGRQFPSLIVNNINTSIGAVLFPLLSQKQESLDNVKTLTRQSIRFSSFAMSPLMILLAFCSEPIVRVVLTEKWIGCVVLMQWFCVVYLFQPIHTANLQALKAIGRSDICLKLEIVKKSVELLTLILVMNVSVMAIVINMAILTFLFTFINAYPNEKILGYTFKNQIKDIFPYIGLATIAGLPGYFIFKIFECNDILNVIAQFLLGLTLYLLMMKLSKNKELLYIQGLICSKFNK